jgi:hypothetical protein
LPVHVLHVRLIGGPQVFLDRNRGRRDHDQQYVILRRMRRRNVSMPDATPNWPLILTTTHSVVINLTHL